MNIESFYKKNIQYFKPLAHILYFSSLEDTISCDPYSDQNNIIQSTKLFNLIYKTIDLNNFFYSLFYLLVPSYIEFSDELISEFYDNALKDYDQYDLFKEYQYRHKYNKQTIRNLLKQKKFNLFIIQFCADYLNVNIIIFDKEMTTIYSRTPTPYKAHVILLKQNNEYQPVFQDKKYIYTSNDQITWVAFRKHVMISKFSL